MSSQEPANDLSCRNSFFMDDPNIRANARKANIVLWITLITMAVEIYFGHITKSMALLADGWHMSTHAAALGITWLTYKLAASPRIVANFNFGGGKLIALGGFASSVFLLVVAIAVAVEAVTRFIHPVDIQFDEALLVAVVGLVINVICAFVLMAKSSDDHHGHHHSQGGGHHHHSHHGQDHNIKAAYIHVIADAVTSVGAILALLGGRFFGFMWLDALVGLASSIVILKWAYGLIKDTAWELLDGHAREVDFKALTARLVNEKAEIIDLHVWKIGPGVLTAELIVKAASSKGISHYRQILEKEFGIHHSVIEERL